MNALSVFLIAAKRLWNNKGLTICAIIGLTCAVALISSVPLYTDTANFRVLKEQLAGRQGDTERTRPPFAFMYRYIGAWHNPIELEKFEPVDEYITNSVAGIVGLPLEQYVRYVKTDNFSLFPLSEAAYIGLRQPLGWVNVAFVSDLQDHIDILEGDTPGEASADSEVVDVMINHLFAEETGIQVGERYVLFKRAQTAPAGEGEDKKTVESKPVQIQARIVGVWAASDPTEPYWFYDPKALASSLVVSEKTFRTRVGPAMEGEVYAALWYFVYDGDNVRTDDVPGLLGRIYYVDTQISNLLPNAMLDVSPVEELEKYRWTTFIMTIILYVFSIPILSLVLYFIGLISGLVVERQRGEIAILKSRGTGDVQVVGIYALEGLMVGAIGLVAGIALGKQLAMVMGNTISFLTFGQREQLPVLLTPRAIRMGLLGVLIGLLASLGPAMRAARLTIVTYKRDRARALEKPLWQRFFLDFLLLIPCGYGYYVLNNRGTIDFLGGNVGAGGDPFSDPLLFLVPALTIFAVSLLMIRLFPLLMEFLAWVAGQISRSVSIVLALRQLARVSKQYTGSLLLLTLTLSLATFTASMARTLDQSLTDRTYYKYGADYRLVESGENPSGTAGGEGFGGGGGASETEASADLFSGWVFVPVSEHLKVPGVEAAARVGSYSARGIFGKTSATGCFYGIDRLDFPKVAFFRPDFGYGELGELMNRLAMNRSALLVNPRFLGDFSLGIGDTVELSVATFGERKDVEFIVSGLIEYFPTYYPDDDCKYLFVGNLEYVFERLGGVFPYDVWIRTEGGVDPEELSGGLSDLDIKVVTISGSREAIEEEQGRPERAGVFGILSVGFVAAAVLTVLGFLLHSFISFRRRFIEFGVLRAIGLSVGQMIGFLGFEQLLLIATGVTAGTGLGVWVSDLFIPFLQVGTDKNIAIPPFVVLIAWDDIGKIYIVFGAMLVLAIAGMIWLLTRLKVFEAVKLGEAV
ncbi:MAG TPA: FtsX-like permease family protein [Anaerolineae bacterium]|nr:FtsX-like permease family protein [Anaerolineae bacterium]